MGYDTMLPDEPQGMTKDEATAYIESICARYGVYGTIISNYSSVPESDLNRHFILASISPETLTLRPGDDGYMSPADILRREQRSDKFFYPHIWAYDLSANDNQMQATEALTNYCHTADFIKELYAAYDTELPHVIRTSEVSMLIDAWDVLHSSKSPPELQAKVRQDLEDFFKREKNPAKKEWMEYFRSDRFPDGKSKLAKTKGFLNRKNQEVDKEQLLAFNGDIMKIEMQEHEYRLFRDLMAKDHPEITYSVGKKEVVDHGINLDLGGPDNPFGQSVTGEEYAVIRKQRFAEDGWEALKDLKMAYWEFRDVYFRDVDEPIIASVYNKITLEYARCNSLGEMLQNGPLHLAQITSTDFMNFVSLAKANHLRFFIDTEGLYATPSLKHVNVIFNESQSEKLAGIIDRMMDDKVAYSHIMDRPALQSLINNIQSGTTPPTRRSFTTPGRE